ncbi:glycosyltransferase family 39 protein [Microlunatus sagamiharensis]|uniref:glycosyltransferase family 39 protein n=1 Tax=Microlunatus sagamiharensis TaxID=546874 RepID=UPI0012FD8B7F|nr:glycosyltransferase family 39 protein [Microlunatus sagamiharensis]
MSIFVARHPGAPAVVSAPRRSAAGPRLVDARAGWSVLALGLGTVAFLARLVPVLRGGGLFGLGNYDDGVYFSAAVALSHGVVPYRDFLLLHPPGIVVLLWPFAVLGHVTGSAVAFAVARVAFMALGATNAVLVALLLRRSGTPAAVVGGLAYALALPAVYIGSSTLLETPASTCLLGALLLLDRVAERRAWARVFGAGLLLALAADTKIWNVVVGAAVLLWVVLRSGPRRTAAFVLGGAVGGVAVCLPFLLLAGPTMWRMVVLDQLARGGSDAPVAVRVSDVLGLTAWQPDVVGWSALTVVAAAVALGCCVLACRRPSGRTAVVLLATTTALLLQVPSWYPHYPGLAVGPLALVLGSAAGVALPTLASWRRAVAGVAVLAALVAWAVPGLQRPFGTRFPAARLAAATDVSGCVTSDDPTTLLELGALDRDLARRCPVVLDLSGYSYDLRTPGRPYPARRRNTAWQQRAMTYLGSGTATLVVRFAHAVGFSARSTRTVDRWPVVAASHGYDVRRPEA